MKNIQICAYTKLDMEQVLPLYQDAGWTNYTDHIEMLENACKGALKMFVAYDEEQLVGIIRVVGDGHSIIYIQDLIVLQSHQRMGIGRRLLQTVLEQYKDVYQTVLMTDEQAKTVAFYKKCGFVPARNIGCMAFVVINRNC